MARSKPKSVKAEPVDSLVVEPSHTQNVESQDEGSESDDSNEASEEEEEAESEEGSQKLWDAIEIVAESAKKGYLIRWAGTDENGQPWEASWEPKDHATPILVQAWEDKKAGKKCQSSKKQQRKPAKLTAKQKKMQGEQIMKLKEESPDPQPKKTTKRSQRSREISTTDSPAPQLPMTRPIKRRLAVPDSDDSSPAPSEAQRSKKQKADAVLSKKVTFTVGTGIRDQSISVCSTTAAAPQTIDKGKNVEVVVVTKEKEEEETLAPAASSNESTNSIVPDSQPAPPKAFEYTFIEGGSQMVEESPQNTQNASQSNAIAGPSRPPPPRSFPTMNSPATTHSELGSDHAQNDDVPIFNDCSQHDDEAEEELQTQQHDTQYYSPVRPVHASTSRQMNRVPVPPASAFFPSEPQSSQFDPIEDPDSSPFRSRQQHNDHLSFARPQSPFEHPQPRKGRIELQLGPSEEDVPEIFSQVSAAFEAEFNASAAASYVSGPAPLNPTPRPVPSSQTIKRPASRPIVAPIAFEIETGGGGAATTAVNVPQAVLPDLDGSDSELDLDDLSPGGINEAYFTSDLLAPSEPLNFDDVVDYERASQNVAGGAQSEAVDAGEGGNSNGGGGSRGAYPYSAYPSNYTQQQQQQQQSNQSQASPIPGFLTSGSSNSYAGNGYGGGGNGGGGGHPYPSHLQPSSSHAHSSKREYEEDREESAKRARRDQEQEQYRQQQQYYQQSQQQQYAPQQYSQHNYAHAQSHAAYPPSGNRPTPPPQQQYSQAPPPQATYHHQSQPQQQQYTRLPPMQTVPPPQSHSDYSRSSSQLPPIQQAIYNTGYPHNPSPHPQPVAPSVSVAAASPPPASAPISGSTSAAAPGRLTSPSIARVQSAETYGNQPPNSANRTPSPLTSLQPLPPQERISSPVPGLDGVNTLIELVRDSPHIEANDGTKEEITTFLRNPTSYGDRPLARSDLWAFELRRQMLDGGEKVDFIILYTREGRFSLKRGSPHEIKFEFARSLVHAPVRVRGSTPAVDAMPTLQSSTSVSIGPLAVSAMTREQLEAEVNVLRSRLSVAETELATLPTVSAENAKLKTEVATLTASNKSLKNSRDSAQQDMSYIQEQYSIASSAAMARAQEAEIAETEAARLQGLLSEGLKQKDLFYKSEVARWKLEVQRMKKEVEFTRAERRKLDERGIREKAGKWDEVVARRKIKADEKEERRLRVEAGGPVEEEEDEEDLDSEEEIVSKILLGERKKSPTPPSSITAVVKLIPDDFTMSTVSTQSSTVEGGGFRCEWRDETQSDSSALPTSCGIVLPTREALMEHCVGHIPSS